MRSSLARITKTHSNEVAVRCFTGSRALFIIAGFLLATAACAQSLPDESGSLPTALPTDQLQLLPPLSSVPVPRQPRARRRLPSPVAQSTPEKIQEAVKKLGVNKHRQWIRFTDL